jgi:hypothetical protein
MTTPELITEEIIHKAVARFLYCGGASSDVPSDVLHRAMRNALLAVQDDMTRAVYNILRGWKRDAMAYEAALRMIRANKCLNAQEIANMALKGEFHEKHEGQE